MPRQLKQCTNLHSEGIHAGFSQNNLQISGKRNFEFGCRCSREKLQKTLSSFDPKEIDEMCNDKGVIEVTCNFCSQKYSFERSEIKTKEKVLQ